MGLWKALCGPANEISSSSPQNYAARKVLSLYINNAAGPLACLTSALFNLWKTPLGAESFPWAERIWHATRRDDIACRPLLGGVRLTSWVQNQLLTWHNLRAGHAKFSPLFRVALFLDHFAVMVGTRLRADLVMDSRSERAATSI